MKPISLTKAMPWLLSSGAVFTLAFSQNVSADNTNSQATNVKKVQNTNLKPADFDQSIFRMVYLKYSG